MPQQLVNPPITKAQRDELEAYYRSNPGDWIGAGKATSVCRRTAKRAWVGPVWRFGECAHLPVLKDVFAEEDRARRQQQAEAENAIRNAKLEEYERQRRLEEEASQMDEAIQRIARSDVLGGLRALGKIREGIEALAERVGKELAAGVDALGHALPPIDPLKVMRMLAAFSHSAKQVVDAAVALETLERAKKGLPSSIIGVADISLEDAEREVALGVVAIRKAKEHGLVVIPGGRSTGTGNAQGGT